MAERTLRSLHAALEGDQEARGELLERLRPRLLLWAAARLSPALRAKVEPDDVVQDVLVALHAGLDGFEGDDERAFLRWLFTVAENRIRDLADHFGTLKRKLPQPESLSQTSPSSLAVRNEMAARVREALTRLSEPHRQVIWMRRFEEREVPEIAAAMDRSENAVRILYCRAIQALRDQLAGSG